MDKNIICRGALILNGIYLKFTEGKQIVKVIHVKNKLVNLIVK